MEKTEYKKIVKKYTKGENILKNVIVSFIVGGFMGFLGNFLVDKYICLFEISKTLASTLMIITLVFLGCFLTALGFFDDMVGFAKCGLIIPITGFAHSMISAGLEYKKEGFVTGIGMNMFKLAGSVIIYGIVSAFFVGLIRLLVGAI